MMLIAGGFLFDRMHEWNRGTIDSDSVARGMNDLFGVMSTKSINWFFVGDLVHLMNGGRRRERERKSARVQCNDNVSLI